MRVPVEKGDVNPAGRRCESALSAALLDDWSREDEVGMDTDTLDGSSDASGSSASPSSDADAVKRRRRLERARASRERVRERAESRYY